MAAETFLFDGHTVYFRLPQACTEVTPAVFLLTGGDPSELMEQAAVLERIDGSILDAYREKLTDPALEAELRAAVEAESWLTAREAARFFNLTVTGPEEIAASAGSAAALARCKAALPAGLREEDENEALAEEIRLRLKLMEMEG